MKKVFLLFLCALTICALFIIPASAAEMEYTGVIEGGKYIGDARPCVYGSATLTLYAEGSNPQHAYFEVEPGTWCTSVDCYITGAEFAEIYFGDGEVRIRILNEEYELLLINCNFTLVYDAEPPKGATIWDVLTGVGEYVSESLNSATALFWNAEAG